MMSTQDLNTTGGGDTYGASGQYMQQTMNSTGFGNTNQQLINPQFGETMNDTQGSFASTFKNRSAAMTTEELRKARESRASEALRMKDEQLKILSEQSSTLLKTLDKVINFLLNMTDLFVIFFLFWCFVA
jgi:hypothetical protein